MLASNFVPGKNPPSIVEDFPHIYGFESYVFYKSFFLAFIFKLSTYSEEKKVQCSNWFGDKGHPGCWQCLHSIDHMWLAIQLFLETMHLTCIVFEL